MVAGNGDGLVLGLSAMCDVASFMGAVAQRELRAENRRRNFALSARSAPV